MTETVLAFLNAHGLSILQSVTCSVVVWGWWSIRRLFVLQADFDAARKETHLRLDSIEKKQACRDSDMAGLREKLDSMPGKDSMHALDVRLADIQAEMLRSNEEVRGSIRAVDTRINGVDTRLAALSNQVDMIIQHHVENSR